MEAWERVWIDAETYSEDVHSYINCTECHGGQSVDDFDAAHEGMVEEVVSSPEACGRCHVDSGQPAFDSLHNTLAGYDTALYQRSAPEHYAALEEMQANHCNDCHATCGDCHVSQPGSVGGGLLEGHDFVPSPSMSRNCTACHGSRVRAEYFGENALSAEENTPSDVHYRARMSCMECHEADSMHGMTNPDATHRYDGIQEPSCESCHDDLNMGSGDEDDIEEHAVHAPDAMSCQVCHGIVYTNCVNCHVEQTEEGTPFFTVEDHFLGFYIGMNPEPNEARPYRYVPVRHVPIAPDSFSFYGENLLPNFDDRPTWLPATPHNIQLNTPQTETCRSCHANEDIFLTRDQVAEDERRANRSVIVGDIPRIGRRR